MMKQIVVTMIMMVLIILLVSDAVHSELTKTADEIVMRSDAVRNPDKPFSLMVTLMEFREGKARDRMVLSVFSKEDQDSGQFRSLIRFMEPLRDQNKLMLKSGNNLWFYDPASKAMVRLSPQQRLMGQASNGDVVTVNFSMDYKAVLESVETITDADRNQRKCFKLDMRALNNTVTYHRIEYWVDTENYRPIKGNFYSESDRILKIVYFRGYREELGKSRPTEIIIIDGIDKKLVTRMNYSNYQYRDIPEEWFQREYLPRFRD